MPLQPVHKKHRKTQSPDSFDIFQRKMMATQDGYTAENKEAHTKELVEVALQLTTTEGLWSRVMWDHVTNRVKGTFETNDKKYSVIISKDESGTIINIRKKFYQTTTSGTSSEITRRIQTVAYGMGRKAIQERALEVPVLMPTNGPPQLDNMRNLRRKAVTVVIVDTTTHDDILIPRHMQELIPAGIAPSANIIARRQVMEGDKVYHKVYISTEPGDMDLFEYLRILQNESTKSRREKALLWGKLLIYQLSENLAKMEHMSVLHRDLKPENMIVNETKHGPYLRFIDWPDSVSSHNQQQRYELENKALSAHRLVGTRSYIHPLAEQQITNGTAFLSVKSWKAQYSDMEKFAAQLVIAEVLTCAGDYRYPNRIVRTRTSPAGPLTNRFVYTDEPTELCARIGGMTGNQGQLSTIVKNIRREYAKNRSEILLPGQPTIPLRRLVAATLVETPRAHHYDVNTLTRENVKNVLITAHRHLTQATPKADDRDEVATPECAALSAADIKLALNDLATNHQNLLTKGRKTTNSHFPDWRPWRTKRESQLGNLLAIDT